MNNIYIYKIVVVGGSGVGKSSLIKRHVTGEFETDHKPTLNPCVYPIEFNTNYGTITFNVWDCPSYIDHKCYENADGAIIMFDDKLEDRIESIFNFIEALKGLRVNGDFESNNILDNSKIVICRNKIDQTFRKLIPYILINIISSTYKYYEISAKRNYNFYKPFLRLAKVLTGKKDLIIESLSDSSYQCNLLNR